MNFKYILLHFFLGISSDIMCQNDFFILIYMYHCVSKMKKDVSRKKKKSKFQAILTIVQKVTLKKREKKF